MPLLIGGVPNLLGAIITRYTTQQETFNMDITIGQQAPDFTLKSHLDTPVTLSDYRGLKNVVIAFFPLAWTPI